MELLRLWDLASLSHDMQNSARIMGHTGMHFFGGQAVS